ncbi:MAG: hypothetical protein QNK04_18205 [Myxococcota bacterium]|nr:hypothetical protein [Myxococcota bacterium]
MTAGDPTLRDVVAQLGPHPATRLGLDLGLPEGRSRWWVAALVLGSGAPEETALRAVRRLAGGGIDEPGALARAASGPTAVQGLLELGSKRVGPLHARLVRSARALVELAPERGAGAALEGIAAGSDGLEELGARLVRLAPGVGPATVLRFVRPLREVWAAAADVPLAPASRTAAAHLGWIDPDLDPLVQPRVLRDRHDAEADAPDPIDSEAALERLGGRACRRGRADLCPLGRACPLARAEAPAVTGV